MRRLSGTLLFFAAIGLVLPTLPDAKPHSARRYTDPGGQFWVDFQNNWAIAASRNDYANFFHRSHERRARVEVSVQRYGPVQSPAQFAQRLIHQNLNDSVLVERPQAVWFNGQEAQTVLYRTRGEEGLIRTWFLEVRGTGYIVQAAGQRGSGDPGRYDAVRDFCKGIHFSRATGGGSGWNDITQYNDPWNAPWSGNQGGNQGGSVQPQDPDTSPFQTGQGNTADPSYPSSGGFTRPGGSTPNYDSGRNIIGVWQKRSGTINGRRMTDAQLSAGGDLYLYDNGRFRWGKYKGSYSLSSGNLNLNGMTGSGYLQGNNLSWSYTVKNVEFVYEMTYCPSCPLR